MFKEVDNMEEFYYYYRDPENNRPVITVCLLQTPTEIGKGVALCSKKDMPVKSVGRTLAKRRALRALKRKETTLPIRVGLYSPQGRPPQTFFTKKSYYSKQPINWLSELTAFEIRLLKGKERIK